MKEKIEEIIIKHCDRHECCMQDDKSKVSEEILSLLPDISQLEVTTICEECKLEWQLGKDQDNSGSCKHCGGMGKATRPATWEDIVSETLSTLGIGSGGLILPSGGILKLKGE